jgi:hypothetical protein
MQSSSIKLSHLDSAIVISIDILHFMQRLHRLRNRQVVFTKEKRAGFTSPGVRPGDVLCVFNGAPVVHVLRRAEGISDHVERWRLVADAFVDGLMHGEADGMDVEERDIVLV